MPEVQKPVVVIADGWLWSRTTSDSPMLDGPGDPIEANIALVRGRKAMVFTHIAKSLATIKAVNAWLRDHLSDAELYQGYGFPYGDVYADIVNDPPVAADAAGELEAYRRGYHDGKAACPDCGSPERGDDTPVSEVAKAPKKPRKPE